MTVEREKEAIRVLLDRRIDAMRHKDADAAVATLSDDIVSFELAAPLSLRPEQARSADGLRAWLGLWQGPIEIEMRELRIAVEGSVAWCHSLNRLRGLRNDGREVDYWMRSTLGLRKTSEGWRIAHGHTSVPLLMDGSYRGAMDLQP